MVQSLKPSRTIALPQAAVAETMPIDLDQEILHNMSSASRSAFMGNMISTYILYQLHSNTRYVHTHGPQRNWGTYLGTKGNQVMYVMSNSGTEFWENVLNTCDLFMTGVD